MKTFAQRLKELRLERSFTLHDMAKKLGVTHVSYHRWENAKAEPSMDSIVELCKIFDVTTDYFFGFENYDYTPATAPAVAPLRIEEQQILHELRDMTPEQLQHILGYIVGYRAATSKRFSVPK